MNIVIKISEELYNYMKSLPFHTFLELIVLNGTPLSKNHGRLKDVDAFISKVKSDRAHSAYLRSWTADDVLDALNNSYAPTIIEADKEAKMKFPAIPRMTNKEAINCISREAVIQIIENKLNPCTDMFKCLEMSEIKEDVEHLPPVTPQTVTEFADKCEECGKIKEDLYEKGFEAGKRYIVEQMCALLEKEGKKDVCKDCYYNDGEVHAECVMCEQDRK